MKTNPFIRTIVAVVLLGATTLPVIAQSHVSPSDAQLHEKYSRIDQAVANGQLTHLEGARLRQHDVIIRFENKMAHISGGTFTRSQRLRLEEKLSRSMHTISHEKHK